LGFVIVVASFLYKLRLEETFMRETFPEQYPGYAASVPRLIPFTKPRQSAPR
jgi:protein-S-isoprenylcysteine O-methyltransferase Ste14